MADVGRKKKGHWFKEKLRVGVVGMYQSGKTAFMTSMINHLRKHDPSRFRIGRKGVGLQWLSSLPASSGVREFPYSAWRDALSLLEWPYKTVGASEYHCLLARSDWKMRSIDLSMIDFPGERLADMSMAGRSYEQWSDAILQVLGGTAEYRRHAGEWLETMEQGDLDVETLLSGYRRLMGRLIFDFLPMVTPSTFLVNAKGIYVEDDLIENGDLEGMVRRRVVGLDAGTQFAPLSETARRQNPQLAKIFAKNYFGYRRQIVEPLADWFNQCNELVVLVDVTSLLMGGIGMFNGNKRMLEHLLGYLELGQGFWKGLSHDMLRLATGGRASLGGVRRIAFVATKADKVHEKDRQKLLHLLGDMIPDAVKTAEYLTNLEVGTFVCAAVNSTASLAEYPLMEGRLAEFDGEVKQFEPAAVPDHWPDNWEAGEFRYPAVLPSMPANKDAPPAHVELDRVTSFLLGA